MAKRAAGGQLGTTGNQLGTGGNQLGAEDKRLKKVPGLKKQTIRLPHSMADGSQGVHKATLVTKAKK